MSLFDRIFFCAWRRWPSYPKSFALNNHDVNDCLLNGTSFKILPESFKLKHGTISLKKKKSTFKLSHITEHYIRFSYPIWINTEVNKFMLKNLNIFVVSTSLKYVYSFWMRGKMNKNINCSMTSKFSCKFCTSGILNLIKWNYMQISNSFFYTEEH